MSLTFKASGVPVWACPETMIFISGNLLEIGVLGYATKQPLVIQSNLIGFKEATDKLNSDN